MKRKDSIQEESLMFTIDSLPNKKVIMKILQGQPDLQQEVKKLKGKPILLPPMLFKQIYQTLQQNLRENNMINREITISITVPHFDHYTLKTDTKKIAKTDFLGLLQESIVNEEDLETANQMYQNIIGEFNENPSKVAVVADSATNKVTPKKVDSEEINAPLVQEDLQEEQEIPVGIVDQKTEPDFSDKSEVIREVSEEKKLSVKVDVNYLKTLNVSKEKISVIDPEYETEKYNQEARKVNKLLHKYSSKLEQEVNGIYQNKNKNLEAESYSKSISLQNQLIHYDNQEELITAYQEKENEFDQKKREKIFSLNEELSKEQKKLELAYEKQLEDLSKTFFKRKNKAINTLDYQFDTWLTTEFKLTWDNHYSDLKGRISSIENQHFEELSEKQQNLISEFQKYLETVKPSYEVVSKRYMEMRRPELKTEILSDINIYQKQKEAEHLNDSLTKAEVAELLQEQERRLQKTLSRREAEDSNKVQQKEKTKKEKISFREMIDKYVTKKVKIVIFSVFMITIVFGLGFSVYKKITYIAPFDTMISSEDYEAAIENYPNRKFEVVDALYNKVLDGNTGALDELKTINKETETPLGNFDLAVFSEDYNEAITQYQEGKGMIPKRYWEKRYAVIGYCYLKKGDVKKAKLFEEKSNDTVLSDKISSYEEMDDKINQLTTQLEQSKEKVNQIENNEEKETIISEIKKQEKSLKQLKNDLKDI
ncbi:hypothetical protein [Enterococcus alishanensis]